MKLLFWAALVVSFPTYGGDHGAEAGMADSLAAFAALSATGTLALEPTLDGLGEAFRKSGIDLAAIQKRMLEKWKDASPDDLYAVQEDMGAAVALAVKNHKAADEEQSKALKEIVETAGRMKKIGFAKMTYKAPDLNTFLVELAPPLAGNAGKGKYFPVAAYLSSQDVCLVCHGAFLKPAPKP